MVGKDIKKNILFVSQKSPLLGKEGAGGGNLKKNHPALKGTPPQRGGEIKIQNTNWINKIPKPNKNYTAQIRYHGESLPCKVVCQGESLTYLSRIPLDTEEAKVIFKKPIFVASGQSCVIYNNDICLGGGVVV